MRYIDWLVIGLNMNVSTIEYVDDLPHLPDELAGALVTSSRASAVLKSIDASDALAMPGVVGVYTAEHVPGDQLIGDIIVDEAVFARDRVEFVGQTVAIVVAESDELAHIAARAVKVEYEDAAEPPVLTIEDAVKRNSFFEMHDHKIEKGDVDTAMVRLKNKSWKFFCKKKIYIW